ncbi:hypothetical protein HOD65_02465 [bacterium]|nr:hypothetical protein [bacterium]
MPDTIPTGINTTIGSIITKKFSSTDAKIYCIKNAFIKGRVHIVLGYKGKQLTNIFINPEDTSKAREYIVIGELISAVLQNSDNPNIVLKELRNIFDPDEKPFNADKYHKSFYSEIADVIEQFFLEVGAIKPIDNTNKNHSIN